METEFGESVHIHRVEALHDAIAMFLVQCPMRFNGETLKFLRVQLNMTQKAMGTTVFLHADAQAVALWEKEKSKEIPGQAEIILRSFYAEAKSGTSTHVTSLLQRFAEDDCQDFHARRVEFQSNDLGEWKMCA